MPTMLPSPAALISIDPETAKAVQEGARFGTKALDVASEAGSWLSSVVSNLPRDAVGLVGDWVQYRRAVRWIDYQADVAERLKSRGVLPPYTDVSPSLALPLITAALDDTRDELKKLWVNLLANALDPSRKASVRNDFIELLKKLEPLDALILQAVALVGGELRPDTVGYFAAKFRRDPPEVEVSLQALLDLGLIGSPGKRVNETPHLTAKGKLLLRAVSE